MNLYKITTDAEYYTLRGMVAYVLADDETSACKKVRETFREWKYGDAECRVVELLAKEGQYVKPCDYLFVCGKMGGAE